MIEHKKWTCAPRTLLQRWNPFGICHFAPQWGERLSDPWQQLRACRVDSDGCLQGPRYPSSYRNSQNCEVTVADGNSKSINVKAFDTETGYDILEVNGRQYSGTAGPNDVVPSGTITWSSATCLKLDCIFLRRWRSEPCWVWFALASSVPGQHFRTGMEINTTTVRICRKKRGYMIHACFIKYEDNWAHIYMFIFVHLYRFGKYMCPYIFTLPVTRFFGKTWWSFRGLVWKSLPFLPNDGVAEKLCDAVSTRGSSLQIVRGLLHHSRWLEAVFAGTLQLWVSQGEPGKPEKCKFYGYDLDHPEPKPVMCIE